jgi:hypothetical protein
MMRALLFWTAIAIIASIPFVLRKPRPPRSPGPTGPDSGGTFGGIPNIVPGMFDPGSAPLPPYEVTEHVRAYEDLSGSNEKEHEP